MRKEYVSYNGNIPVKVELLNIKEHPIHWHDAIELLMVLKGSIEVTIESDNYVVEENEIEIINMEECHRIHSDEDNMVLMIHMDPNFFQKYYDDIKNMFFYTDTTEENIQQGDEKYEILRKYISIIVCEVVQKGDDYDEYIEETMVELLYHLLNNFHYLIYEKEELKDNEEQLERYHRIAKYIYNNYNNKISLQDIAEKEFLSAHYLSHEIKSTMGLSFKDFVNLTRVQESIKLLLDTDMTISDISLEVGFSHIRYYNKHFKKHYNMTPMQYRKMYKVDDSKLEEIKDVECYDLDMAMEYLTAFLEDYDRFNYDDKIIKISINASDVLENFEHPYKNSIWLPKAENLMDYYNRNIIKNIQKDITFDYGRLSGLFVREFKNVKMAKDVIDFILSLDLRPDIIIDDVDKDTLRILDEFLAYFSDEYGNYEIGKWRYTIDKRIEVDRKQKLKELLIDEWGLPAEEEEILEIQQNEIYDTSYMLPYTIHHGLRDGKKISFLKIIDDIALSLDKNNEVFFGDSGIINWEGIRKPSYYAYQFLSRLGDKVVAQGEGYIVTSKGDDIQILLYTYNEEMENLIKLSEINKLRGKKNIAQRNISLNITNLFKEYKVTKYEIYERINSCYNKYLSLGSPRRLSDEEIDLIKIACNPKIDMEYRKKNTVHHLGIKIQGYGAVLITFNAVK